MERQYFDAKFEGLEKLMVHQNNNLSQHIQAVSGNVKRLESDLSDHKEKTDVHGLGENRRFTDSLAKWGSVILAGVAIALGVRKHQ